MIYLLLALYFTGYGYTLHAWKGTLRDGGLIVRMFLGIFWPGAVIYNVLEDV